MVVRPRRNKFYCASLKCENGDTAYTQLIFHWENTWLILKPEKLSFCQLGYFKWETSKYRTGTNSYWIQTICLSIRKNTGTVQAFLQTEDLKKALTSAVEIVANIPIPPLAIMADYHTSLLLFLLFALQAEDLARTSNESKILWQHSYILLCGMWRETPTSCEVKRASCIKTIY